MAYIKVDHSKFETAASSIDTYISQLESKMIRANGEVNNLSSNWQGDDAVHFKSQWNTVANNDSTYVKMTKSLEAYSKSLRYAAKLYKDAQTNAVNNANGLPRY